MLQAHEENFGEQDTAKQIQESTATTTYRKFRDKADVVLATGILPIGMLNSKLKTTLLSLKNKDDVPIPTRRLGMI